MTFEICGPVLISAQLSFIAISVWDAFACSKPQNLAKSNSVWRCVVMEPAARCLEGYIGSFGVPLMQGRSLGGGAYHAGKRGRFWDESSETTHPAA